MPQELILRTQQFSKAVVTEVLSGGTRQSHKETIKKKKKKEQFYVGFKCPKDFKQ